MASPMPAAMDAAECPYSVPISRTRVHPRTRIRRCVELHADASYRVIGFRTADYLRDFEIFAAALARLANRM